MEAAVLLAEPEAATRGFLERHLSADGFEVLGAQAGLEALALAELADPDLVLLDETLPEYGGLDVCPPLRASGPGRRWDPQGPRIFPAESGAPVGRRRASSRARDRH